MEHSSRKVLVPWTCEAPRTANEIVLPDGCCDFILMERHCERPTLIATSVDDTARRVGVTLGDRFVGLRLRPGVTINRTALARTTDVERERLVRGELDMSRFIRACPNVEDALAAIELEAATGKPAASNLGISQRTLQRVVVRGTGRTPSWWRRLARVRRTACRIAKAQLSGLNLAEIAFASGFSDQPHMTREFRAWLGATPAAIGKVPTLKRLACEAGYGVSPSSG